MVFPASAPNDPSGKQPRKRRSDRGKKRASPPEGSLTSFAVAPPQLLVRGRRQLEQIATTLNPGDEIVMSIVPRGGLPSHPIRLPLDAAGRARVPKRRFRGPDKKPRKKRCDGARCRKGLTEQEWAREWHRLAAERGTASSKSGEAAAAPKKDIEGSQSPPGASASAGAIWKWKREPNPNDRDGMLKTKEKRKQDKKLAKGTTSSTKTPNPRGKNLLVSTVARNAAVQAYGVWNSAVACPPYVPAGMPRPMLPVGFGPPVPVVNPAAAARMTQFQISQSMLQQQAIQRHLHQLRTSQSLLSAAAGRAAPPASAAKVPTGNNPAAAAASVATAAKPTNETPPGASKPANLVPAAAAKVSVEQHKKFYRKGFVMLSDVSESEEDKDSKNGDDEVSEDEGEIRNIVIPRGKLGITVRFGSEENVVLSVEDGCPFKDKINVGDRVLSVDGRKATCVKDLVFHVHNVRWLKVAPRKDFVMSSPDVSDASESNEDGYSNDDDDEIRQEEGETRDIVIPLPPGKLGIAVRFGSKENVVLSVEDSCPFKHKINVGDRVISVNGRKVTSANDFVLQRPAVRLLKIAPKPDPVEEEEEYVKSRIEDFLGSRGCTTTRSPTRIAQAAKLTKEEAMKPSSAKKSGNAAESRAEALIKKLCRKNWKKFKKVALRQEQRKEFYAWHTKWEKYQSQQLAQYVGAASDDGWGRRCRQLEEYKRENNGEVNNVSPKYKAPDDMTFGEWVAHQRELYHEGRLPIERAQYLREQGLDFHYTPPLAKSYTGDEDWDAKFLELIEYRITNGDCNVPITYPDGESLGQWVQKQRDAYFAGTLDETRHKFLEEKGFLFEPGTNVQKSIIDPYWWNSYNELKQFKRDHGHIDVPLDYKATPFSAYLDRWLSFESTKCRKKELSFHKIRLLKELGYDAAAKKAHDYSKQWDKSFEELVAYKSVHGNCLVPTAHGGRNNLGQWVRRQRKQFKKGVLTEDRLRRLLDVGFDFDPRNQDPEKNARIAATLPPPKERDISMFNSTDWSDNYEALRRFIETNGHVEVDPEYNDEQVEGCLFTWLETQKTFFEKEELPLRNVELLEELGVDLTERSNYDKSRHDVRWNDTFKYLKMFHEKFGHVNVPTKSAAIDFDDIPDNLPFCECRDLSKWIGRQRSHYQLGKLSDDRRRKLEELGVDLTRTVRGADSKPRKKRTDKPRKDFLAKKEEAARQQALFLEQQATQRKVKHCKRCLFHGAGTATSCAGRGGQHYCCYFEECGTPKQPQNKRRKCPKQCKRCVRFGKEAAGVCPGRGGERYCLFNEEGVWKTE